MASIVDKRESIQYTGANGAAVAAWCHSSGVVSDNGTILVVSTYEQGNMSFEVGDWLIRTTTGAGLHNFAGNFTNAQYQNLFVELP